MPISHRGTLMAGLAVALSHSVARSDPFLELLEVQQAEVRRRIEAPVVSPDGLHVYAPVEGGDTVAIFDRDALTGAATFSAFNEDGGGGTVVHFGGHLAISPDGAHLYVTDYNDFSLSVFTRDAGTGALTLVETHVDGVAGVSGLNGAWQVAISPDGSHVYVTGYTATYAVAVFARHAVTGALTFVEAEITPGNGDVVVSPDGTHVYVGGASTIRGFVRDPGTGALAVIADASTTLGGIEDMAISPDGLHLYTVGHTAGGRLTLFARNPTTGVLTLGPSIFRTAPEDVAVAPSGSHVYIVEQFDRTVVPFARAPGSGVLTEEAPIPVGTVDQPFGLTVAPGGLDVYVGAADALVTVHDGGVGLALAGAERAGGGVPGLWDAADAVVSADGAHVYAAGNQDDAIAIFARDPGSGTLTPLGVVEDGVGGADGLDGARDLLLSPDDAHLYVLADRENSVAVFSRDAGTGALAFVEVHRDGVAGVAGLANSHRFFMSPDGLHLYATMGAIFARTPATGALAFVADLGPVQRNVAFSADGNHAYRAVGGAAIVAYDRNPATGLLTPIDQEIEGVNGVPDLSGLRDVAVSADDAFVYVVGQDHILTFVRDPASGMLTFDRVSPDIELSGVTPGVDAATVFGVSDTLSFSIDSLVLLGWNPLKRIFGTLDARDDMVAIGYAFAAEPQVSRTPDGRHLYMTSAGADALAVYAVSPCAPAVIKAKVVIKRVAPDPTPGDESLVLKGSARLRNTTFAMLDPEASGMRVLVERADGSTVADVTIPGGAFAGGGTAGWRQDVAGTTWTYLDKTPAPPNGIKKVSLRDGGLTLPGHVQVKIASKPLGSYPITSSELPPAVTLELGDPQVCARTGFAAPQCRFDPTGTIKCKSP